MAVMQERRLAALGALLAAALVLAGACAPRQQPDLGDLQVFCPLARFVELGVDVSVAIVRLEPAGEGEPTELELEIDGTTATGAVALTPGTWYLTAELYGADEALVATGQATAVVLPGAVTQVRLRVSLVSGGIDVEVEWDEGPSLYIADISHRPAVVEIADVGRFSISGLSRVGWDVQVIETPTTGGRTHKEPGLVSYPDVAMLELRSGEEEVVALAAWAERSRPGSAVLYLEGLGGEGYIVLLSGIVPVAADTGITEVPNSRDLEMGGIRLRVGRIELLEYVPPFLREFWEPEPGQWIQIDGVETEMGYAPGVLDVPEVGTSDPLFLPAIWGGENVYRWAAEALEYIDEWGGIPRKNLSVIDVDAEGDETGRLNFFEVWPASITLFNPERPYGESYLLDVLVVCDFIERG